MSAPVRKRSRTVAVGHLKNDRYHGGFADTEPMEDAGEFMPVDAVDAILERYTGAKVPLEQVFPDAPPPPSGQAVLERAARLPARQSLAQDDPNRRFVIETEAAYRKEAQLKIMHRFILRHGDMQQISNVLGLPLDQTYQLRRELFGRMAKEAGNIDMMVHSARTIAFYDEIRAQALRHHDSFPDVVPGTPMSNGVDRARFLALAMAAENNKHKFLQIAGFYDNVKLHPAPPQTDGPDDMAVLRQAMTAMLDPSLHEAEIDNMLENGMDDMGMGMGETSDDILKLL